jgi:hypothetical protein
MAEAQRKAEQSDYKCCDYFQPALDPNILRAYAGYCKARAWPFTVMVPLGGFDEPCPKPPARKKEAGKA